MKKLCIYDGIKLSKEQENLLEENGFTTCYDDCADCFAVLIRNLTKIDKQFLESHPLLKYVVRAGVGLDNVDIEECKKKQIEVINAPGSNAFSVAELFFFHVINAQRMLCNAIKDVKDLKRFPDRKEYVGNNLKGKTMGIVGLGNVGKEIVKRLKGWKVKQIMAYDVVKDKDFAKEHGIKYVPIEDIFKKSDVIAICVPLLKETYHLINKDLLGLCTSKPILVNLSRGEVVNEKDILEALNKETISFYCADVIYDEKSPTQEDRELISHPRTYITPHLGANTKEALAEMVSQALRTLINRVRGKV